MKKLLIVIAVALLTCIGCNSKLDSREELLTGGNDLESIEENERSIVIENSVEPEALLAEDKGLSAENTEESVYQKEHIFKAYAVTFEGWTGGVVYYDKDELEKMPREKTVAFGGNTYSGNYERSGYYILGEQIFDEYSIEGMTSFSVDHVTGEVIGFRPMGAQEFIDQENYPTIINTDEEAIEWAKEYAAEYIDIENYVVDHVIGIVDCSDPNSMMPFQVIHVFFIRMIEGLPTTDEVLVTLTDKGYLFQIELLNNHKYDDLTSEQIKAMKEIDIEALLDAYRIETNDENPDQELLDIAISNNIMANPAWGISYTPEGELCIVVTVDIREKNLWSVDDNGNPVIYEGLRNIIIK
ncbi:MAG: hypothetical protein IJM90_08235 [Firmicutes bacterium]|nr:hypothetical protein [Bacillota bacterium]